MAIPLFCISLFSCSDEEEADNRESERAKWAKSILALPLEQRVSSFRNINRLFHTHPISKGSEVAALPREDRSFVGFRYGIGDATSFTIDDFMERNRVTGLLVIKDGSIQLERYGMGNDEHTQWASFSVAKSFVATLTGMAVRDGLVELRQPVRKYLPDFSGTAYGEVLVGQLMQMSSGIAWEEDYSSPESDFKMLFDNIAEGDASAMREHLKARRRLYPPGTRFNYSTGDATLLGMVLQGALGEERLEDYLSRKVWECIGMESDACWVTEGPEGKAWGGGIICMTLRDEGRFGQFILDGGYIAGEPLLPDDWSLCAYQPAADAPHLAYGNLYGTINGCEEPFAYPLGYGYCWWCTPPKMEGMGRSATYGRMGRPHNIPATHRLFIHAKQLYGFGRFRAVSSCQSQRAAGHGSLECVG